MQVFEREAAVTEYEFVCTGDSGENRLEIVDFWGRWWYNRYTEERKWNRGGNC